MKSTAPDVPEETPNVRSGILNITDRQRNALKVLFSAFLSVGMLYGVLVWMELVPYVF